MTSRIGGLGALLLAGLAVTACGSDSTSDDGDLKVGNLLPLSGTLGPYGPAGRKAGELAVDELNEARKQAGIGGSISIEAEDDQSDPQGGVSAARQLTGGGEVPCLVGAYASATTIPVARAVSIPSRLLQISGVSSADEISDLPDDGFVNRVALPDSFQGKALAQAIADDLGGAQGKVVNIGARNDAFGTGLTDTFTAAWEGLGGRVAAKVVYDVTQPSYDGEAREIVAGDADAFLIIDFPETFKKVGPALVRTGRWRADKTWSNDAMGSADLSKAVSPEVVDGLRGTTPAAPSDAPAARRFDEAYREAPGPDRNTFDVQVFDATMLCGLAAIAAKSTDPEDMRDALRDLTAPPGKKYTWLQLPAAIKALDAGKDIDFDGASGPLDLDEHGDPTAGVYDIYRFAGGEPETVEQVEVRR